MWHASLQARWERRMLMFRGCANSSRCASSTLGMGAGSIGSQFAPRRGEGKVISRTHRQRDGTLKSVDFGTAFFSDRNGQSDGLACWQNAFEAIQIDTGRALSKAMILALEVELNAHQIWTHQTDYYLAWIRHIVSRHLQSGQNDLANASTDASARQLKQLEHVLKVTRLKFELIKLGNTFHLQAPASKPSHRNGDLGSSATASASAEVPSGKSASTQAQLRECRRCQTRFHNLRSYPLLLDTPSSRLSYEQTNVILPITPSPIAHVVPETNANPSLTFRTQRSPAASPLTRQFTTHANPPSSATPCPPTALLAFQSGLPDNRPDSQRDNPPHTSRFRLLDVALAAVTPAIGMAPPKLGSGFGFNSVSNGFARKRLPDVALESLIETAKMAKSPERVVEQPTMVDFFTNRTSHFVQATSGRHLRPMAGMTRSAPGHMHWARQPTLEPVARSKQRKPRLSFSNVTSNMDTYVPVYPANFRSSYNAPGPSSFQTWPVTRAATFAAWQDVMPTEPRSSAFDDPALNTAIAPLSSQMHDDPIARPPFTGKRKHCEDYFADEEEEVDDRLRYKEPKKYRSKARGCRGARKAKHEDE